MNPATDPFILFIRHGERLPLPADDPFADVGLTARGYAEVARLADVLRPRLCWTAASPFLRCRATAHGLGKEPAVDTRLGLHGPWVVDPDLAAREFAARGTEGVMRALVAGTRLGGMRSPEEAVPLLLSAGLDRAAAGSGVCVSHDAVLMPAMGWLFGEAAVEDWLAPLDGFAVELRANGPVVVWRGRERRC
ncbi:MAG: histidine phosphatase family protein [Myxococcales bacterium]|nr:histidine phosphatase family protein [Myxococcales bacterium]